MVTQVSQYSQQEVDVAPVCELSRSICGNENIFVHEENWGKCSFWKVVVFFDTVAGKRKSCFHETFKKSENTFTWSESRLAGRS